ncbi:MAG TPA: YigZ family protein [Saprospiraceae bacterium]|nr:YigZ family protein [Saprospiraceae bacterium]
MEIKSDTFYTIAEAAITDTREKASKFIAYAYPLQDETEVEVRLGALWKLHPKATHICYAYKLGSDGNRFRMVDDGEPSNTAGKPIYGQILSRGLTDTAVFVVRYYGGTKLGASGLISAYKEAASEVLDLAGKVEKQELMKAFFSIDYAEMGQVLNALKSVDFEIIDKHFGEMAKVEVTCGLADFDQKWHQLKCLLLALPDEMVDEKTVVPFCQLVNKTIFRP